MDSIPGYDAWKLATPPEYEERGPRRVEVETTIRLARYVEEIDNSFEVTVRVSAYFSEGNPEEITFHQAIGPQLEITPEDEEAAIEALREEWETGADDYCGPDRMEDL